MPEDRPLVIRVQNTPEDLAHFLKNMRDAGSDHRGLAVVAVPVLVGAFVCFVLGPSWLKANFALSYEIAVMASLFVLAISVAVTIKIYAYVGRANVNQQNAVIWAPQDFTFSPDGVIVSGAHARSELSWRAFVKAKETKTHYFLYMDPGFAYLVPKRAFPSREDETRFATILRDHLHSPSSEPR